MSFNLRLRHFLTWCWRNPDDKRELVVNKNSTTDNLSAVAQRTKDVFRKDYLEGYLRNSFRLIETYYKYRRVSCGEIIFGINQ